MVRSFMVAMMVVGSAAVAEPTLELEVGAGAIDIKSPGPTFTGRIGVDVLGFLTPSLRLTSVSPLTAGQSEWVALAELRAHTPGLVQLTGGVAVGLATASVQPTDPSASVTRSEPWLQGDLGLRVVLGRFWAGATVGAIPVQQLWMATLNVGVSFFGD